MYLLLSQSIVISTKCLVLLLILFVLLGVNRKTLLSFLQQSMHTQWVG